MRRLAPLVIALVTFGVWAPTLTYDWVYLWDDWALYAGNPMIRSWSWVWFVQTMHYGHWMPVTWVSATATYALWGVNPMAWHAVNVGLHTVSAVLVFFMARRLVGSEWGALVASLVFAVHPLRMESVAWISERKDVLLGVFFLGAALLWMQGRRRWAFLAFVAACLSKSPAVVLPVFLLAYEWWAHRSRGERLPTSLAWALAPFVAVSAAISVIAFRSLDTIPNSVAWTLVPLGRRLLHVAYSLVFYAAQTVWPSRLSNLIEYTWLPSWEQPQYPLAVGACLATACFLLLTHRRWPALPAAAVCYAVAVLPQSGLFQNGPQLVANRYSYLACLPLALLAGGAVTWLWDRRPVASVGFSAAGLAALATITTLALPMWKDSDTLWSYAAAHEPTCTQCQDMATAAAYRRGDFASALRYQDAAILVSETTLLPRWERHWNRGGLLLALGRPDEARQALETYLAVVPAALRDAEPDRSHLARARATLATLPKGAL